MSNSVTADYVNFSLDDATRKQLMIDHAAYENCDIDETDLLKDHTTRLLRAIGLPHERNPEYWTRRLVQEIHRYGASKYFGV